MVELNSTLFPFLGSIDSLVNTIKVLVGGVFGIYLIILYLKWREYVVLKKMLIDIRRDLRVIAGKQKIELEPIKEPPLVELRKWVGAVWKEKKKERKDNIASETASETRKSGAKKK